MFRKIVRPVFNASKRTAGAIACPPDEPSFYEMVEINYNEASKLVEESLMKKAKETYSLMDSVERKKRRNQDEAHALAEIRGILASMRPCNHVIQINFPIARDDGSYENITESIQKLQENYQQNLKFIIFSTFYWFPSSTLPTSTSNQRRYAILFRCLRR